MRDALEEVLKRKEINQMLWFDEQRAHQSFTKAQWFTVLLSKLWNRFNAATAKQAKRCKLSAHRFG
jgi:hypothetical protein